MSDLELKDGQEKKPAALLRPRGGPVSGPTLFVLSGDKSCPLGQRRSVLSGGCWDSPQSHWAVGKGQEAALASAFGRAPVLDLEG